MVRPVMILVCDNQAMVSQCQEFAQQKGIGIQTYSTAEWQSRQGETTVPTLVGGNASTEVGAKIIQFPTRNNFAGDASRFQTMNELESLAIENAISEFGGNLTEAAKALGIGRATLYRKVKQYNIDPSAARKKRAA